MRHILLLRIVLAFTVSMAVSGTSLAQPKGSTALGDISRGYGRYFEGLSWYNLRTSQAKAVDTKSMIEWNKYVHEAYLDNCRRLALKRQSTNLQRTLTLAAFQQRLRESPTASDIRSGDALNVLLVDLSGPTIPAFPWKEDQDVPLPAEFTLRSLTFRLPAGGVAFSPKSLHLGCLHIAEHWPVVMRREALKSEREAYEAAAAALALTCKNGDPNKTLGDSVVNLRNAVQALKEKADSVVGDERGERLYLIRFMQRLEGATQLLGTLGYADALIGETEQHDARTVEELLAFMQKFGLVFGSTEDMPEFNGAYDDLYRRLRKQREMLGVAVTSSPPASSSGSPDSSSGWFTNSSSSSESAASTAATSKSSANDPKIVMVWEHRVDNGPKQRHVFYSNGKINKVDGKATWSLDDNVLTMIWPNKKAPSGKWVNHCKISSDGKSYLDKNANGHRITGKRVD